MGLNSNQLKQFIAIAEEENITRASQKLFMSQSALSNTLKLLEEELGCNLFDRKSNRLVLNANGKKLFGYAKKTIELLDLAERDLKAAKHSKPSINIAVSSHLYFSTFFKSNISLWRKYHLKVLENSFSDIFDLLDRRNCDIAIAPDYPDIHRNLDRFERILLGKEQLMVCFPVAHPLGGKESVAISELNGEQFYSFENDIDFRWQDYLFMQKGYFVDYCLELPRGYTRSADGFGIDYPSFLTSFGYKVSGDSSPDYRFVPISDPEATRNIYIWYKTESEELVKNVIREFGISETG